MSDVRGIDAWISRGHERMDDEPERDEVYEPAPVMAPAEREAALRRMEQHANPLIREMAANLRKLDPATGPVCEHNVDTTKAACGTCLGQQIEDETMGVALAARLERRR